MPTLYMLIGIPASGKSTWVANQNFDWNNTAVISSDAIIDRRAADQGKTYSDVFRSEIKSATSEMNQNLRDAIANNMNIILDQTNVTAKSRQAKLAQIPDNYTKVAVYFQTPDITELQRRLANRPGKNIPQNIVMGMMSQLEPPRSSEGFDKIIKA